MVQSSLEMSVRPFNAHRILADARLERLEEERDGRGCEQSVVFGELEGNLGRTTIRLASIYL